ncbi:hypothetical protein B0H66DRAFT_468594 [Apodospora peruviana]|uniref:Uncharacterized protein n=1 Tax=Apodospora peruviana TaxID=516989 RepID=A0AAE0IUH5_9PEZI|nr:hypothetical protein B0H66DRAFT_468594 [Apodospora peruviana]
MGISEPAVTEIESDSEPELPQTHGPEKGFRCFIEPIISFNKDRIGLYLRGLQSHLVTCIASLTDDGKLPSLILHYQDNRKASHRSPKPEKHSGADSNKILTCDSHWRRFVLWAELRHFLGRLLSYANAPRVILSAHQSWPELFWDVEVEFVPSSVPMPNPFPPSRRCPTAETIIGRLFSSEDEIARCRNQATALQAFGLDDMIRNQINARGLKPIVHTEMLVLDWLERSGGVAPDRFFNHSQYIGSSKPTCRFCWLWFTMHPGGVKVRSRHGNLYTACRPPDTYRMLEDPRAEEVRLMIIARIRESMRELCKQILNDRQPRRRPHGTETFSSRPSCWTMGTHESQVILGQRALPVSHGSSVMSGQESSLQRRNRAPFIDIQSYLANLSLETPSSSQLSRDSTSHDQLNIAGNDGNGLDSENEGDNEEGGVPVLDWNL